MECGIFEIIAGNLLFIRLIVHFFQYEPYKIRLNTVDINIVYNSAVIKQIEYGLFCVFSKISRKYSLLITA